MRILITLGSEKFQFDRLSLMIDHLNHLTDFSHQFVFQIGKYTQHPKITNNIELFDFIPEEEFKCSAEKCDVIISHCGEGSLLLLQQLEKPYILVPRLKEYKEHVDSHQLELAQILKSKGIPVGNKIEDLVEFLIKPEFISFKLDSTAICQNLTSKYMECSKVLNVCSSGGHYHAMKSLYPFFKNKRVTWVTFSNDTTRKELKGTSLEWAFFPTNRNIPNLIRNLLLAPKVLTKHKPDLVVSTGAGIAVPFLLVAHLLGIKTVFVESFTRVEDLSLSAKILVWLRALDTLVVQHPTVKDKYPQAILHSL